MSVHPDQALEQAFVDRAYDRIESLRAEATELLAEAYRGRGAGTPQGLMERDVMVESLLRRLEQLSIGNESLCFGRIDFADTNQGDSTLTSIDGRESFRIGRMAVADEQQEPLVVDWRAPIAEPFYRATGKHPMGLSRRRHLLTNGRKVIDLEDELFDDGEQVGTGLVGGSVLMAALDRGRSGRMRDIVATIQAEQDEIIRSSLNGTLIVQGGPGTGKTAVALHRAAYLLYTHRFPLESQGVLLVGPNTVFLRYVSHVLPSLGESGVELSTISGLVSLPGGPERRPVAESRAIAAIKGDLRMASFVRKAVSDRQRPLRNDLIVPYGSSQLRISVADSAEITRQGRRRGGTHNGRRRFVENLLFHRLFDEQQRAFDRSIRTGMRHVAEDAEVAPTIEYEDFVEVIRHEPTVREALNRMWPWLTPFELLHDLFGAAPLLKLASSNLLSDDESALLVRGRCTSIDEVPWTDADVPLLDEALALLGPVKPKKGEPEPIRTFGHVVVDEAQDLSPMQLRMIGRRSLSGSLTLVGDLAQATGPAAVDEWDSVLRHLTPVNNQKLNPQYVELSVSYRTPSEILDVAGSVLAEAAPSLTCPTAVRDSDVQPIVEHIELADQGARVVEQAQALRAEIGEGTVAVIAAPSLCDDIEKAFRNAGLSVENAYQSLESDYVVVSSDVMKGLEFDGVLLVEPSAIIEESNQGLKSLYVALTRATRRLTIVHSRELPPSLARGLGYS